MAVDPDSTAAQNYDSNTSASAWVGGLADADADGDEWTGGLSDAGVDNADDLDGDSIWGGEWESFAGDVDEDSDSAQDYDSNTSAEAWAGGWGDASDWDV